jgi:hypothetical protein
MELTVLVVLIITFSSNWALPLPAPLAIILSLFIAHYLHRSLVFPLFLRTRGKQMPLIVLLAGIGFNCVNGFFFGYYFSHFANYPSDWLLDPRFSLGVVLFVMGAGINIFSDYQLIRLRKPGTTEYSIPQGILFQYISCPNHFGEILEWIGFAIFSWSLPGLAFAFWTFANLAPRAVAHHRWYQEHFPNYPPKRKALLPVLW